MVILHNTTIKTRLLIPLSTLKIILGRAQTYIRFFNNARKSFIVELFSLAKLQERKCRGIWQQRSHVT